jgi:antitoxin HicB
MVAAVQGFDGCMVVIRMQGFGLIDYGHGLDILGVEDTLALNTMKWREAVGTKEYNFTVLFEPAEEGGYVVTCPALPGLVTEGDTLEEARDMVRDAIKAYLESLQKDGLPIPHDKELRNQPVKEKVHVVLQGV